MNLKVLVAALTALGLTATGLVLVELFRVPRALVVDGQQECPTEAATRGISRYLDNAVRKRHAIVQLVLAERVYDDRREPPSLFQRTIDYYRASIVTTNIDGPVLVRLLCTGPVVVIRGKRLAGIPSVAAEVFDTNVESISADQYYLAACGVVGAERGARNALMGVSEDASAIDELISACN